MTTNPNNQEKKLEETPIYGAPGSTLQTPEEHRHDQQVDPRKDNTLEVSNDDLRQSDADKIRETLDGKRGDTEVDDRLSNNED